ncbi:MAG: cytochrome B [Gammaproteobacteria bacterium]|nr:MAG: cytochrome B [Gammaproteobacteria bacterium]
MQFKNNSKQYGIVAILFHWLMAVVIIGLFFLGDYMVDLTYYDSWYVSAPNWHRSIGAISFLLLALRFIWRLKNIHPAGLGQMWENRLASYVHSLFYLLLLIIMISGYLITTADGQAISVFNWFDIPATVYGFTNQEDIAGEIHYYLATGLILLVILHALAAFKHHFINRDATLRRML